MLFKMNAYMKFHDIFWLLNMKGSTPVVCLQGNLKETDFIHPLIFKSSCLEAIAEMAQKSEVISEKSLADVSSVFRCHVV